MPTNRISPDVFNLPPSRAAKTDPALIDRDRAHFAALQKSIRSQIERLTERRDHLRRLPGRSGQEALERDLEIHRLSARLHLLQRYGADLTLGHMQPAATERPVYVGRAGLADDRGAPLLVDWRAAAAEPFFAATHAQPMGLAYRRRYHWQGGAILDYWDEVFAGGDREHSAALDDQSAFVASLGAARAPRMRDVLATIQRDQDEIIRTASAGPLVVDGGPGTGKTVVALHRAAFLLYSDPRLGRRRGGLLFVGPHESYLAYVSDVLPSLGENDVQVCTIRDLVPEGEVARPEADVTVAHLKASAQMVRAVEAAVAMYEEPPTAPLVVETPWQDIAVSTADWSDAFSSPEPGTPHNEAHDQVWSALIELLSERFDDDVPPELVRGSLGRNSALRSAFRRAWPILKPQDLVADLWAVPAYLRMCAPWLSAEHRALLRRPEGSIWTVSDLPILDAMSARLGDRSLVRAQRTHDASVAERREYMDAVVTSLIAADDDGEGLVTSLVQSDLREVLDDDSANLDLDRDPLAGQFAHIIVDEAQELTDAEWAMLLRRCPSRSMTIVGDRAQARTPFTESWSERLERVGLGTPRISTLTVNYRTPVEVMDEAAPVIRSVVPGANVPISVRSTGMPVRHVGVEDLEDVVREWTAEHPDGIGCVIGSATFAETERVRTLTPAQVKGLEFDLVVLVEPSGFGASVTGSVDRYVAMTRATQQLVIAGE